MHPVCFSRDCGALLCAAETVEEKAEQMRHPGLCIQLVAGENHDTDSGGRRKLAPEEEQMSYHDFLEVDLEQSFLKGRLP